MPFVESLLDSIAGGIFEQTIKAGKYAIKDVRGTYSEVEHTQRVIAAANSYIDVYQRRHCQIQIMPGLMSAPRELGEIYTAVKLLDSKSRRAFLGPQALETAYREKGTRGFGASDAPRIEGMEVANEQPLLMVLGAPGIGKSTFLRKIGLEALKKDGAIIHECIPVFLELKKFREPDIDIKQKIVEEFAICQFPAPEVLVESALEQGKLLVLFDGLDEVPSENLDQVLEKIQDFVDRYAQPLEDKTSRNRFVASCRIAAYPRSALRFTDVTIAEFDDEQIEAFIHRWFNSPEDRELKIADEYIKLLNQYDYRATKELAQTPLLLTFLCLVYDREQNLPSQRSALYGRALNIILHEWSAQKRINRSEIYKGFHPDLEKIMLAEIAYESFKGDQLFFSKQIVKGYISGFLSDMLGAPKYSDAEAVLEAIEVQQGILVERATDFYSFSHLTLQEYLTALHIVDNHLEAELVEQCLVDERWREVFFLVAGLKGRSVIQLLEEMEERSRTYLDGYSGLQRLVQWSARNQGEKTELHERVMMISIAISLDLASATDIALTKALAPAVVRALDIAFVLTRVLNIATASEEIAILDIHSPLVGARSQASFIVARAHQISQTKVRHKALEIVMDIALAAKAIALAFASDINHWFLRDETFNLLADELSMYRDSVLKDIGIVEVEETWADGRLSFWWRVLNLEADDIQLSEAEALALRDYLYASELILQCKQSAIYISSEQWKMLEERLLTVVDEAESRIAQKLAILDDLEAQSAQELAMLAKAVCES